MSCDVDSLRTESRCLSCSVSSDRELLAMLVEQLCAIANGGGGGGGGSAEGVNYCFSGLSPNQVLKIKNVTTGLANRIDTKNTDPTVALNIDDGSAC